VEPHRIDSTNAASTVPIRTLEPEPEQSDRSFPWTGLAILLVFTGLVSVAAVPATEPTADELDSERLSLEADLALAELRAAVRAYELDHGIPPGRAPRASVLTPSGEVSALRAASPVWFRRQLLMNSDGTGETVPQELDSHPFGPYLGNLPKNPVNGRSDVRVVVGLKRTSALADGESGWVYDVETGRVRLNALGRLYGTSQPYFDL
jgi:hypothetical protein